MTTVILRPNANYGVPSGYGNWSYTTSVAPYQDVDEVAADDGTTEWERTASVTECCYLCGIPDLPADVGSINKITSVIRGYSTGTKSTKEPYAYATHHFAFYIGGVVYKGIGYKQQAGYTTSQEDWATNPNTGSAWTISVINNLIIGATADNVACDSSVFSRVTQLYIIVDYNVLVSGSGAILI